jgi:nitroreductase
MDDSFTHVISTTRSIRRFTGDPVPDDVLHRVLQAAVWAPSGGNRQPWRMVVVRDTELKRSLGAIYAEEWATYVDFNMKNVEGADESVRSRVAAGLAVGTRMADTLHEIPVVVLFVHDPSLLYVTDDKLGRTPVVGGASLYPAVQNLLLAARAEGLGGVLTTLISRSEPRVQELLGIPQKWGVHAMVPLGWPRGSHGPLTRRPVDEMVHWDRWQN